MYQYNIKTWPQFSHTHLTYYRYVHQCPPPQPRELLRQPLTLYYLSSLLCTPPQKFHVLVIRLTCFLRVVCRDLTSISSVKTKFLICPSSWVLWDSPPIRSRSHLNFRPPTISMFTWSHGLDTCVCVCVIEFTNEVTVYTQWESSCSS